MRLALMVGAIVVALGPAPATAQDGRSGAWRSSCKIDKLDDRRVCAYVLSMSVKGIEGYLHIEGPLAILGLRIGGRISSGGIRVDGGAALRCVGMYAARGRSYCDFAEASQGNVAALHDALMAGRKMLIQITGEGVVLDFQADAAGYRDLMAKSGK